MHGLMQPLALDIASKKHLYLRMFGSKETSDPASFPWVMEIPYSFDHDCGGDIFLRFLCVYYDAVFTLYTVKPQCLATLQHRTGGSGSRCGGPGPRRCTVEKFRTKNIMLSIHRTTCRQCRFRSRLDTWSSNVFRGSRSGRFLDHIRKAYVVCSRFCLVYTCGRGIWLICGEMRTDGTACGIFQATVTCSMSVHTQPFVLPENLPHARPIRQWFCSDLLGSSTQAYVSPFFILALFITRLPARHLCLLYRVLSC